MLRITSTRARFGALCTCTKTDVIISDLLYQNLFKPDHLGKSGVAASTRATRPLADGAQPMAKHAAAGGNNNNNNKMTAATGMADDEITKTRAVVADVSGSKSAANEKRAEKCKEKCPANIKECCRNAIQGT